MSRSPSPKTSGPSPETYLYQPAVPQADAVRLGLAFPAPDSFALSSLGYLTLFRQLDENPAVAVSRIAADTLTPGQLRELELVGFSFSFELDILEILRMLDVSGVPLYAKDRTADHPLIFAGGPTVMTNPEPFADFFDFFLIGEGEDILRDFVQAYRSLRHIRDRNELLYRLSLAVPGLYAPSLYVVEYTAPDGPIARIAPRHDDLPAVITKRMVETMDDVASSPILSEQAVFSNTFLVEVMRGCSHRCRFCLASYSMLPARGGPIERVIERIAFGTQHTNKVGLLGALIADHPEFPALCDYLDSREGLRISAASLRADTLTPQMAATFKKGGMRQVTIAVESGSERLRRRINKNLRHESILAAAEAVSQAGLKGLKLYGMVGLPDETEEDVAQLANLVKELRKAHPRLDLHLGCSSFVPKAATPFQWQPRPDNKTLDRRFALLRKALLKVADFRPQSTKWDYFQGILSRGDRRLAPFIERFYRLGGSLGSINRAYKELKGEKLTAFPDLDWYALRERPEHEVLPWEHIHLGVSKEILYKEGLPPPGFK